MHALRGNLCQSAIVNVWNLHLQYQHYRHTLLTTSQPLEVSEKVFSFPVKCCFSSKHDRKNIVSHDHN